VRAIRIGAARAQLFLDRGQRADAARGQRRARLQQRAFGRGRAGAAGRAVA